MVILPMDDSHVAAVAELEKTCFSDPWSEKSVASELENPLSLWLVAKVGDCLAGYIGSQTVLGEADMMNLAVDPNFRRQGIGEALVLQLVKELKSILRRHKIAFAEGKYQAGAGQYVQVLASASWKFATTL